MNDILYNTPDSQSSEEPAEIHEVLTALDAPVADNVRLRPFVGYYFHVNYRRFVKSVLTKDIHIL